MPPQHKLGIVMDPIEAIKPWKDTTFAMMLEGQARGWQIYYFTLDDIFLDNGISRGRYRTLSVQDKREHWFDYGEAGECRLDELDVILMRKDPPFSLEYIYCTYILEQAEENGVLVVNRPASLRDCNEKLYTRQFPDCCVDTLVSRNPAILKEFILEHGDVIVKPLDGMGGESVFRIQNGDLNTNVIIEAVSKHGHSQTMAQRYIPEIRDGDKRILLIDGRPIPYALARVPAAGDNRGNIAAGGSTRGQPLSERDQWLCDRIGPDLKARGLTFVGLDVIGDYVTEINVTSPTGMRELDREFGINISAELFECIESKLAG